MYPNLLCIICAALLTLYYFNIICVISEKNNLTLKIRISSMEYTLTYSVKSAQRDPLSIISILSVLSAENPPLPHYPKSDYVQQEI